MFLYAWSHFLLHPHEVDSNIYEASLKPELFKFDEKRIKTVGMWMWGIANISKVSKELEDHDLERELLRKIMTMTLNTWVPMTTFLETVIANSQSIEWKS